MSGTDEFSADVVIVGSGMASAMASYFLVKRGISVLILEAGPRITREDIFEEYRKSDKFDPVSMYPNTRLAPRPDPNTPDEYLINTGPTNYNPQYIRAVGGTTWHWSAGTSRFSPVDFRMKSTYGVGVDWPIKYSDLEPYYAQADEELGVSGESNPDARAYRSTPYPMKPIPIPYLYERVSNILKPHGFRFSNRKQARNSREYDGRPICVGNNNCIPICPIGAQYAAVHHIEKAEALGAKVIENALVTKLIPSDDGQIKEVEFKRADDSKHTARGKIVILAANALESTKLLFLSANEAYPTGLANASDQVGRNLMDHPGVVTRIRMKEPVYPGRGPTNAGGFTNFTNGAFRRDRAACGLSIENRIRLHEITNELLLQGYKGDSLEREIRHRAARTFELLSFAEQLPDAERRMTLDYENRDSAGLPRMKLHFDISDYTTRGLDFMSKIHLEIGRHLDAEEVTPLAVAYTANHLIGTARMGRNASTSVVDSECRTHQHKNLFLASSAVFPTSGGNKGPTLTIAAISIRIADSVAKQLQGL